MTLQGNLLVGDDTGRVQEFTPQGKYVRCLAQNLGSMVTDLAVTSNGDVWVSLYNCDAIQLHDGTSGALIRSVSCSRPWALALMSDGSIAVGCDGLPSIVLFDANGNQRWTCHLRNQTYTRDVAIADNELFVGDFVGKRIQVLSVMDGKITRQICLDEKISTSGIAYDANARVLFVAEHDDVSIWSLGGDFLHSFVTKHYINPMYRKQMAVASDGAIYIADSRDYRIIVF
jgi:hypothetical protein